MRCDAIRIHRVCLALPLPCDDVVYTYLPTKQPTYICNVMEKDISASICAYNTCTHIHNDVHLSYG